MQCRKDQFAVSLKKMAKFFKISFTLLLTLFILLAGGEEREKESEIEVGSVSSSLILFNAFHIDEDATLAVKFSEDSIRDVRYGEVAARDVKLRPGERFSIVFENRTNGGIKMVAIYNIYTLLIRNGIRYSLLQIANTNSLHS